MVLTFTGAVFFSVWIYCLLMTLVLALIHYPRAGRFSIRLAPQKLVCGEWTQAGFQEINYQETRSEIPVNKNCLQLPGILVRCRVLLSTKDKRRIVYDFKPVSAGIGQQEVFQINNRGAYYSVYDEYAIFDILGFFRFAFRLPVQDIVRILAGPCTVIEPVSVRASGGDYQRQDTLPVERTDDLIDHRPYVPGDDPRRINWKLYGHAGELIIRQGEREPPPQSNLTILIDTEFDSLYTLNSAAVAVDLLCANALAVINSAGKDKDIQIGYTGQNETADKQVLSSLAEMGFFLAYPAALLSSAEMHSLPSVPEDRAIVIFALPRVIGEKMALDHFLLKHTNRSIDLIFVFNTEDNTPAAWAAEKCAVFYSSRPGVRTRVIGITEKE
jgi:hypothetical protein